MVWWQFATIAVILFLIYTTLFKIANILQAIGMNMFPEPTLQERQMNAEMKARSDDY